jgi:colanic acid biosynthesis glycosyl transferase WcaI
LVLHQHYWPEIAATAQILTDICEDLSAMGHQVTVLCGQPSYRCMGSKRTLSSRENRRGVAVERVWSYTPAKRTIPLRLLHYGSYFGSSLAAAVLRERPDVCFVMSTPPLLLGVSGSLLRVLRNVPFVYSVQDLYPDIAVHLGVLPDRGLATSIIEQVARACYGAAASLVTLSPGMADKLAAKGISADRIHVIPNWADTESVKAAPRNNGLARELGLADGFVVQYSGNLGMSQGLEHVIATAELLRDLPITIALIGDGNAREGLQREATRKSLTNVRFFAPQPRENLSELLSACDVGLVTMKKGVGSDLVPSKLYGIMAAARPVLAAVELESEVARIVRGHACGTVVEAESPSALAEGIRRAFAAPVAERVAQGERGRQTCTTAYSRKALTKRYAEVLYASASPAR